jgi:xanthine dehydrogenase/oxidase
VKCVVRRIGGGFGGKETKSIFVAGALGVAAAHLKRPVHHLCTREEDMATSGQSHPFKGKYKVGFSQEGVVEGLAVTLYTNAGATICCSDVVMDR